MPARLRSLLTFGLSDAVASLHEHLDRLQSDVAALRALVVATDEHAQRKLKAGLASAVNLISVLPQLKIEGVLPPFPHRGFEVSGELAVFLFHLVRRHRPRLILELGGGSSTILFAAALKANGSGRLISVEHDREHLDRTAQYLRQTELSDWVELIEAPLVAQRFGDRSLHWYDLARLLRSLPEKIELLFVDGPPGKLQALSRYPALPVLLPHLSPHAHVLVDDGRREDETQMIELWRELNVRFEAEPLGFLPRAPTLLRLEASESRVAEFPRPRSEHQEPSLIEPDLAAERRTGST